MNGCSFLRGVTLDVGTRSFGDGAALILLLENLPNSFTGNSESSGFKKCSGQRWCRNKAALDKQLPEIMPAAGRTAHVRAHENQLSRLSGIHFL